MRKSYARKKLEKKIARTRMSDLFSKAIVSAQEGNMSLANRYVTLARNYHLKFKLRMSQCEKQLVCKHCYRFLMPSKTSRVRVQNGKIVVLCLSCKKFMRRPLGR